MFAADVQSIVSTNRESLLGFMRIEALGDMGNTSTVVFEASGQISETA